MTPKEFDGRFLIRPNGDLDNPVTITFYRRETDTKSIEEFIDSIKPDDIGWDAVTRQLFYKSASLKTYKLDFKEL